MVRTTRGVVCGGVIVPDEPLAEGASVSITLNEVNVPPELEAEFAAWGRASDDALRRFEQALEGEAGDAAR